MKLWISRTGREWDIIESEGLKVFQQLGSFDTLPMLVLSAISTEGIVPVRIFTEERDLRWVVDRLKNGDLGFSEIETVEIPDLKG